MATQRKTYTWKEKLHEIIYEADTTAGKVFDLILLVFILASIALVMLESVNEINAKYEEIINIAEWVITILFTIEYIARIITIKKPLKYIFSFYGIIDLLSTIPKYLSFIFIGSHALVTLRALRLLRVFRILKLARYLGASNQLKDSIIASRVKILVFLFAVVISSVIFGSIMYLVEGEENGFTNIPKSVYWCIVTLTTVGFGDIAPQTPLGQFITSIIMILGYGIIAVPTGIVSAEYVKSSTKDKDEKTKQDLKQEIIDEIYPEVHLNTQVCSKCHTENHTDDADFCRKCGTALH
jgi:voltage-gated potassium channel